MAENYRFDYYYGSEADQFSFIRVPKALIKDKRFKSTSSDAKLLYGLLLDRMSLSMKNKWLDDENRVYIIFTIEEIMEEFDCSENTAIKWLKELDEKAGVGLIEKKRQGLGRPNLIYVKNFIVCEEDTEEKSELEETEGEVLDFQNRKNLRFKNCENLQDQSSKTAQNQNRKNLRFKNCSNLRANNTYYNNTDLNDTESIYPIYPADRQDGMDVIEQYTEIVQENISYDVLRGDLSSGNRELLDEIVQLMVEVLSVERDSFRIAGAEYPYQLVKERFLNIGFLHVQYVLDCLEKTTNKIGNIKAYLLASLFNAPATFNAYYTVEVQHDMAEGMGTHH